MTVFQWVAHWAAQKALPRVKKTHQMADWRAEQYLK